jgi:hypothetical protein
VDNCSHTFHADWDLHSFVGFETVVESVVGCDFIDVGVEDQVIGCSPESLLPLIAGFEVPYLQGCFEVTFGVRIEFDQG